MQSFIDKIPICLIVILSDSFKALQINDGPTRQKFLYADIRGCKFPLHNFWSTRIFLMRRWFDNISLIVGDMQHLSNIILFQVGNLNSMRMLEWFHFAVWNKHHQIFWILSYINNSNSVGFVEIKHDILYLTDTEPYKSIYKL